MDLVGDRTLADLLTDRATAYPETTAMVFEDRHGTVVAYTYEELYDTVRAAAAGFAGLGIRRGDAVVVHLRNCPEFVFCWFALAWVGAVMVPSNVASSPAELRHVVGHSEAVGVVTEPEYADLFDRLLPELPTLRHRVLARTAGGRHDTITFDELSSRRPAAAVAGVGSEDVVEMIFTSGTTARPKAVMLTHANCLWAGERVSRGAALDHADRLLTSLPLFHVNAQEITVLAALTLGSTFVVLEEYHASRFWSQVRAHGASAVSLVATQVRTLLAQPERGDDADHELRRVVYAINVTDGEKDEFERRFGVDLLNGYGLSEGGTVVTMAPVFGDRCWPSVGLPNFDRRVRVVGEDGRDVPVGTVGEILVSGVPGRTLMKGYFKDPEATAAAITDGWLHTGDNGYADEQGYLYFFDRKKDVIKRAGENVSASEVEAALLTHPAVAEAAVVGRPDPVRDEEVVAFVVPAEGASLTTGEVTEHCRTQLAYFKVPTVVELVPELPKTSIGKVEKKRLRERLTSADAEAVRR